MRDFLPFNFEGNFYKGNLHCHSVVSDGDLTKEQLKKLYMENGYHFLCFSEHERYTDFSELNEDNFIVVPAIECSVECFQPWLGVTETHHVHGVLGTDEMIAEARENAFKHMELEPQVPISDKDCVRKICDNLIKRGCISIYNHPMWSCTDHTDFMDIEGFTAFEIYNHGCEVESHTGNCENLWDIMLKKGKKIFAVATDDNHNRINDSCGGYIVVKAESLTRNDIAKAILNGTYYSSCGPEIYDYGVKDGVAYVECSAVDHINFVAGKYVGNGMTVWGDKRDENTLTSAQFKLNGGEDYVRIECVDKTGKKAWSNPIFLK